MKKYTQEDYEDFHKSTKAQSKIIGRDNFTYRLHLKLLNTYVKSQDRVLDIGCGAGTLALYLAAKGNKVLGIDISEKAVKEARKSAEKNSLKNVQFNVINFPDEVPTGKYDVVILTEVIEHLLDDHLAVKKINKLLEKNGVLILSTPSQNAPLHKLGMTKEFDKRVGHIRRYKETELRKILEENGFYILHVMKTEGIVRNFLFVNPVAGKFVRFVKYFIADVVTYVDDASRKLLGESNFVIVAKKK